MWKQPIDAGRICIQTACAIPEEPCWAYDPVGPFLSPRGISADLQMAASLRDGVEEIRKAFDERLITDYRDLRLLVLKLQEGR
jgi:hypothetical protein